MRMEVSEHGDEVCIELFGVAGRHQRILQALLRTPLGVPEAPDSESEAPALAAADVTVRAAADVMHIRLKARTAHSLQALSIYHHLRHALLEREADEARAVTA